LLFFLKATCQEFNYVHYDTKDGLAGSTVYRICQDKKGYIWFATDNGVSRFDGKRFKNFTTEDGLTDNEVLYIACDSQGRVWMMPFNKTICYYYEGKIYNNKNESKLSGVVFNTYISTVAQNKNNEVYLVSVDGVYLYPNSGKIRQIADFEKLGAQYNLQPSEFNVTNYTDKPPYSFALINRDMVFSEKDGVFYFFKKRKSQLRLLRDYLWVDDSIEPIHFKYPPPELYTNAIFISDSLALYNTFDGSWLMNRDGIVGKKPFLPGKQVSSSLRDSEGSIWFTTLGEGVYKLTSRSMKTYVPSEEFFSVEKSGDKIVAGTGKGSILMIGNRFFSEEQFQAKYQSSNNPGPANPGRLYAMATDSSGAIFLGFDFYLAEIKGGKKIFSPIRPIKSIDIIDNNQILVCTSIYTLKVRSSDLIVLDTIWKERGTKVVYDKGNYYIGTLNGLVIIDKHGGVTKLEENNSLLGKRIVDICKAPDGSLWIATNDNGVLQFKNGVVDTVINSKNGLSSNICKSVFLAGKYLWVGTNKGINKIDWTTKKILMNYSTSDGLASDVINAIYVDKDTVWVCTPAGLTYFNEKDIQNNSICNLDLNSIRVSGNEMKPQNLELSYKKNNISFDFTAISFKAAGEITYHYKLDGLDKTWQETKQNSLRYPSLPPGYYVFQLYAINKFGKQSDVIQIPFTIAAPFWKTIWFWILVAVLGIIGVWYLFKRRYRKIQQQLEEKNRTTKRIAELEQTALRAQMNPHFIFNCLSSIQHFVLKGDFERANHYITQLATLIRQTLDNSSKSSISIADEINYLTNYLEMEQMRFVSKFQYDISLDKKIEPERTFIPPMMLQPFIENAIRHGIRHKEGQGLISIRIEKHDGFLEFIVEDNGVGRKISERYKTRQHIEYQSKGISLTRERMEILAANDQEKINTVITDLHDDQGNSAGTRVMISFPLGVIDKLN
jgi:hypothetical protein